MKNLKVRTKIGAVLLSGFIMAGSVVGITKAKDTGYYELESTSISTLIEEEDICDLTTVDEEIANGNTDFISKDELFRKKVMELNYYKSSGEDDLYNETLNWLRDHFEDTALEILFDATKGAIADEEKTSISKIKLSPAPDYDEDSLFASGGYASIEDKDFHVEGYKIKSKEMNDAISLIVEIQDTNFNEMSAKDIVKKYDEVTETAKLVMASGASRHDNVFKEKNSKKYIKKKYNI